MNMCSMFNGIVVGTCNRLFDTTLCVCLFACVFVVLVGLIQPVINIAA